MDVGAADGVVDRVAGQVRAELPEVTAEEASSAARLWLAVLRTELASDVCRERLLFDRTLLSLAMRPRGVRPQPVLPRAVPATG